MLTLNLLRRKRVGNLKSKMTQDCSAPYTPLLRSLMILSLMSSIFVSYSFYSMISVNAATETDLNNFQNNLNTLLKSAQASSSELNKLHSSAVEYYGFTCGEFKSQSGCDTSKTALEQGNTINNLWSTAVNSFANALKDKSYIGEVGSDSVGIYLKDVNFAMSSISSKLSNAISSLEEIKCATIECGEYRGQALLILDKFSSEYKQTKSLYDSLLKADISETIIESKVQSSDERIQEALVLWNSCRSQQKSNEECINDYKNNAEKALQISAVNNPNTASVFPEGAAQDLKDALNPSGFTAQIPAKTPGQVIINNPGKSTVEKILIISPPAGDAVLDLYEMKLGSVPDYLNQKLSGTFTDPVQGKINWPDPKKYDIDTLMSMSIRNRLGKQLAKAEAENVAQIQFKYELKNSPKLITQGISILGSAIDESLSSFNNFSNVKLLYYDPAKKDWIEVQTAQLSECLSDFCSFVSAPINSDGYFAVVLESDSEIKGGNFMVWIILVIVAIASAGYIYFKNKR